MKSFVKAILVFTSGLLLFAGIAESAYAAAVESPPVVVKFYNHTSQTLGGGYGYTSNIQNAIKFNPEGVPTLTANQSASVRIKVADTFNKNASGIVFFTPSEREGAYGSCQVNVPLDIMGLSKALYISGAPTASSEQGSFNCTATGIDQHHARIDIYPTS